jgi:hypothetical protein
MARTAAVILALSTTLAACEAPFDTGTGTDVPVVAGGTVYCHGDCATSGDCVSGLSCFDTTGGKVCLPAGCASCFQAGDLCTSNRTHDAEGNELCAFDSCTPPTTGGKWEYSGTATLSQFWCDASNPGTVTPCPVQTVPATGFVNHATTWVEVTFTYPALVYADSGATCTVDPASTGEFNHYATTFTAGGDYTMAGTIAGHFDETTLTGSGCSASVCNCDTANAGYDQVTFTLTRIP